MKKGVINITNKIITVDAIANMFLKHKPSALAYVKGSEKYPDIEGRVYFYGTTAGVVIVTSLSGLPGPDQPCYRAILGMHIHEGTKCSGNSSDPFADAKGHFNPYGCEHPQHAGDLPPVFSSGGRAWSAVLLNKFSINDILGKTVIIHSMPDDFKSQPSGNSGEKIACGVIVKET